MRLSDDLAARRCFYAMPLITAPAVMVIDIPGRFAAQPNTLALGRYYIVMIESEAELTEFEAFLDTDRDTPCSLDLLDRRPSNRDTSAISLFEFAPPAPGWPCILLTHWPRDLAQLVGTDPEALARGAYSMDAFKDQDALQAEIKSIIAAFGEAVHVRHMSPLPRAAGRA